VEPKLRRLAAVQRAQLLKVHFELEDDGPDAGDAWVLLTLDEARKLMCSLEGYFEREDQQVAGWHCHVGGPSRLGDDNPELTVAIPRDPAEPLFSEPREQRL
jgi:hypothetical protein